MRESESEECVSTFSNVLIFYSSNKWKSSVGTAKMLYHVLQTLISTTILNQVNAKFPEAGV